MSGSSTPSIKPSYSYIELSYSDMKKMVFWLDDFSIAFEKVERILGSHAKASLWFETENPQLGGVMPYRMLICGNGEKLLRFIEEAERENGEI